MDITYFTKRRHETQCAKCGHVIKTDEPHWKFQGSDMRSYCLKCGDKLATFSFVHAKGYKADTHK